MGRLLDEDDVIDAINKRISILQKHPEFRRKHADIDLYGIKPMIAELPSVQPEPHWIPCSERLPEKDQICIVTDETRSNTYEYRFCNQTYDEDQGWTYLKHRIIAWMPLPEPHQEGADHEQT